MKRKAAAFCFAFALAELAAAYLPPSAVLLLAALFILLALWQGILSAGKKTLHALFIPTVGAVLGFAFFAGFYAVRVRPVLAYTGRTAECTVTVGTDCESSYVEGMCRATLHVTELDGQPVNFYVDCSLFPDSRPGERFTATVTFCSLEENSFRASKNARGVYLAARYEEGYQRQADASGFTFTLYRLRKALSSKLRTWMPGREGGVAAALLLGDRSFLSAEVKNNFRAAGVSHLLAISGLHIMLLCGFLAGDPSGMERFSRPRILMQAVLVICYVLLTGMPISVVRAGVVYFVALLGYLLLQPPDTITSLGFCAVGLSLLGGAYLPCDIGFQLSFCAAIAVQIAGGMIRKLRRKIRGNARKHPQDRTFFDLAIEFALGILSDLLGAVLASLAVLPALVAHGMAASGVSVLTNLLVVWVLRPVLQLSLLVLAVSLVPMFGPGTRALSLLLGFSIKLWCAVVEWCASLPFARLQLPREYTLYACVVLTFLTWYLAYRVKLRQWPGLVLLAAVAAVIAGIWFDRDVVRIDIVGNTANPCAVVTQNGRAVVLFRGGTANLNAVENALQSKGLDDAVYVDLRQSGVTLDFCTERLYTLETQGPFLRQVTLLDDVSAELYHTEDGNLAVLDVEGYRITMSAGSIQMETPLQTDLFLAGASYPACVYADDILTLTSRIHWTDRVTDETILLGGETPQIVLRPGRSVRYVEVSGNVVQ
ncbi:MAG: ComEC/Rec2 family competence protein [Gemmiger sp.]